MLYIVATPIGHLKDISERALSTLKSVDYILSEDTRKTLILKQHFGISTKTKSYHKFNEKKMLPYILKDLHAGMDIALVSDAGTPMISDPGQLLVENIIREGLNYTAIPGPSALTNAATLSGFPIQSLHFYGFLPKTKNHIKASLNKARGIGETALFFVASNGLKNLFLALYEQNDDTCKFCLIKEMTKLHETIWHFDSATIPTDLDQRGEFVFIMHAKPISTHSIPSESALISMVKGYELPSKVSADLLSKMTGKSKRHFYDIFKKRKS